MRKWRWEYPCIYASLEYTFQFEIQLRTQISKRSRLTELQFSISLQCSMLIVDEDDWSPKLLHMLKSWDEFFGYKESDAGSW